MLECGLGGRLDSTNIVSSSVLTVITGIDFDHTAILGDTIEKIAYEKAGIIKEGIPVLWCGDHAAARSVIKSVADEKNAPYYEVDRSTLDVKTTTLDGTFFDFNRFCDVKINLLGTYQVLNATNVLTAVDILKKQGLVINDDSVYSGMESATWIARFERLSSDPTVIFDGAHNPQGIDSCVASVKEYFNGNRVIIVTGVMADKDYKYIAGKIGEIAKEVMCVTPNNPRALDSREYAEEFLRQGICANGFDTVNEAVRAAVEKAKKEKAAVICLGSLYMYSEIEAAVKYISDTNNPMT